VDQAFDREGQRQGHNMRVSSFPESAAAVLVAA